MFAGLSAQVGQLPGGRFCIPFAVMCKGILAVEILCDGQFMEAEECEGEHVASVWLHHLLA